MTDEELRKCKTAFTSALTECVNIGLRAVDLYTAVAEEKKDGKRILQLQSKRKVLLEVPRILNPKVQVAKDLDALLALWPGDVFRTPL